MRQSTSYSTTATCPRTKHYIIRPIVCTVFFKLLSSFSHFHSMVRLSYLWMSAFTGCVVVSLIWVFLVQRRVLSSRLLKSFQSWGESCRRCRRYLRMSKGGNNPSDIETAREGYVSYAFEYVCFWRECISHIRRIIHHLSSLIGTQYSLLWSLVDIIESRTAYITALWSRSLPSVFKGTYVPFPGIFVQYQRWGMSSTTADRSYY